VTLVTLVCGIGVFAFFGPAVFLFWGLMILVLMSANK